MTGMDYYQILGVSKEADTAQIKSAFRDLAFKYHPDRNIDDSDAADKMKAVNEAYAVLSNPEKRRDYDSHRQRYGSTGAYTHFRNTYSDQDIFSGTDLHKIFDELAQSFGFRNFNDISKDFYGGKAKTFEFKNKDVNVKGFFFFGSFNLGKAPLNLNFPGKLGWLAKTLLQHFSGNQLPLQGIDLYDSIRIDPDLARTGGPYAYYHKRRSKKLIVKIPPNVRHGQQIRLSGMGEENQGSPGDLYLKIETGNTFLDSLKKFLPF